MGSDFSVAGCGALLSLLGITGGASGVPPPAAGFLGVVDGGLIGLTGGFLTRGTVLKFCSDLADGVGVVDREGKDLKRLLLLLFVLLLLLLGGVLRFLWSFLLVGILASILFLATGPRSHCDRSSISFCTGGVGGEFPSPLLQDELSWLTVLK